MKSLKYLTLLVLGYSSMSWANDELSLKTHRDIVEKMPLISLQPMLDFCRDAQPLSKESLERAYVQAKLKLIHAVKAVNQESNIAMQSEDLDQPIDLAFKQDVQQMLESMSLALQTVDATQYCPNLIMKLQYFNEVEFKQIVQQQYQLYLNRTQNTKADATRE